jgi:ankyrin repeat protein
MKSLYVLVAALALVLASLSATARSPGFQECVRQLKAGQVNELGRTLKGSVGGFTSVERAELMALALDRKKPELIRALIDAGLDPNAPLPFAQEGETTLVTPLLYAISSRAGSASVGALLEGGAKPDLSSEGVIPLHFALSLNEYDVASQLLDHGASPKLVDDVVKMTALMELVVGADDHDPMAVTLVQRLVKEGTNVNARTSRGATALRFAVTGGKLMLTKALLAAHADPNSSDDKGETVLQLARRKHFDGIASALQQAGAAQ